MAVEPLSSRLIKQKIFDEIKWRPVIEGEVYPSAIINVRPGCLFIPATHVAKMLFRTSADSLARNHFENAGREVADLKTIGTIGNCLDVSDFVNLTLASKSL